MTQMLKLVYRDFKMYICVCVCVCVCAYVPVYAGIPRWC